MQTTETTNLSPAEFALALEKLQACQSAVKWSQGMDYDTAWQTCQNPSWMFFLINAVAPLDPITNELMICRFAREVVHLTDDPRVLACIETRESWARGEATDEQRTVARGDAWDIAKTCIHASARDTEWAVACTVMRATACDAAGDSARAGQKVATRSATGVAQCDIIREMVARPLLEVTWKYIIHRWN